MRITHEADYAIRAIYCLAVANEKVAAKQISESTGVTLRFALKILRKLIHAGFVKSFKGANGGYMLDRPASQISFGEIIECIDGPIAINHCLTNEFDCTRVSLKSDCDFRRIFTSINKRLRDDLYEVMIDQFLPGVPPAET